MKLSNGLVFAMYVAVAASAWLPRAEILATNSNLWLEIAAVLLVLGLAAVGGEGLDVGRAGRWRSAMGSGILLFGLPGVISSFGGGLFPELTRVALLSLVPGVVVLVTSISGSHPSSFLGNLGASLAGVAGVLLLLSVDPGVLLERPLAGVLLMVVVGGAGWGSYLGHVALTGSSLRTAIIWMLGPCLGLMLGAAWVGHNAPVMPGWGDVVLVGWRGVTVLLLVFLMREVDPIALASRYLLIPLVTAVEGYVLLRPALSWRMLLGASLLLAGSAMLLRGRAEEDSVVSLF